MMGARLSEDNEPAADWLSSVEFARRAFGELGRREIPLKARNRNNSTSPLPITSTRRLSRQDGREIFSGTKAERG
jgi:hypothetical protein